MRDEKKHVLLETLFLITHHSMGEQAMGIKRIVAVLALGLAMTGQAQARFQDMGVGARAMGMGRAFTAVANDASALYWNAAGITQIRKMEGLVLYAPVFAGLSAKVLDDSGLLKDDRMALTYGAVVFPTRYLNIGVDTHVFTSFLYDEYRVSLGLAKYFGIPDGTGIAFSGKFKLLGYGLSSNQYVQSNPFFAANGTSKQGVTADFGMLFKATDRLGFGASWENVVPVDMALGAAKDNVPFLLRLGTSLKWPLNAFDDFHSAIDVTIRNNEVNNQRQVGLHAGAEITLYNEALAFRTGFNVSPRYVDDGFQFDELAFGLGYKHRHVRVDYTLIMARNLKETFGSHMFSIGFQR
jgi:hypothetical protein